MGRKRGTDDEDHDDHDDHDHGPPAKSGMSPLVIVLIVVAVLVVMCGVVSIVAAIAIPNLIEARQGGNEAAAIGALKTIGVSQAVFSQNDREEDNVMDYGTLQELGDSTLIDPVLASGTKQGYLFAVKPSPTTPELLFAATATPAVPGTTGSRYFFTNHTGVVWYRMDRPFDLNDPTCSPPPDARPVAR